MVGQLAVWTGLPKRCARMCLSLLSDLWTDNRSNISSRPAGTARTSTNPTNLTWHIPSTTHFTALVLPLILSGYQGLCSNH